MQYSKTNRAVQTQHNDHEEEDDGKESSSRHICDGFCINDEQQTGTWEEQQRGRLKRHFAVVFTTITVENNVFGNVLVCCPTSIFGHSIHILLPHLSHVAQYGKDDKARQEASQTVYWAGDQSISEMEKEEAWVAGRFPWSSMWLLLQHSLYYQRCVQEKFLLVAVVMKWVVTGKGKEYAKPRTQWEEDLSCCINPYLELMMVAVNDVCQVMQFVHAVCMKTRATWKSNMN